MRPSSMDELEEQTILDAVGLLFREIIFKNFEELSQPCRVGGPRGAGDKVAVGDGVSDFEGDEGGPG